jgi:hypothetical protein
MSKTQGKQLRNWMIKRDTRLQLVELYTSNWQTIRFPTLFISLLRLPWLCRSRWKWIPELPVQHPPSFSTQKVDAFYTLVVLDLHERLGWEIR